MVKLDCIYNEDCLQGLKKVQSNSVDAVITDPPYNIGKDSWDRIDNYCDWFLSVVKECSRVLKDNGTFWFFHMDFDILSKLHNRIIYETSFRHKQMIIIDKGKQSIAGRTSDMLRSYPRATEYLQFYFSDNNKFIRNFLKENRKKSGLTIKQVANSLGIYQAMYGFFEQNNSCPRIPTEEQWNKLKKLFDFDLDYLKVKYYFKPCFGFTDVWRVNFYKEKNNGHCTQKPLSLMHRIIKTATKQGMVVCDPFIGSGSTALACKQLRRHFIGFEIDKEYYDISLKRLLNVPRRLEEFQT